MKSREFNIKRMLMDLGVSPDLLGFSYLAAAVDIKSAANAAGDFKKPYTEIYREVAKKFNSTYTRTERAMRYAVLMSFDKHTERCSSMFSAMKKRTKHAVTLSCFVGTLAEYLQIEESGA